MPCCSHGYLKISNYQQFIQSEDTSGSKRTNNKRIYFPIWCSQSTYLSPPLCPSTTDHPPSRSHVFHHSLALHPFSVYFFLSLSFSALSIPVVVKAMVFCGGSCLGLICQTADLPSLLFSFSSSLSRPLLLLFTVVKKTE